MRVVAAVTAVLISGALLPVLSQTPSREITLVARGMSFYLLGDPTTANPTIRVAPGETVRLVLRNDDRGMTHDVAVPALGEAMDLVKWNETGSVTIAVPSTPGTYEYHCRPHMLMMKGMILVE
jgi:FtsP/CotA-like multicopper oxidase with cupredoxin domain